MCFPLRVSGTSPDTMAAATPSATAVLPTPASPTRHGLFFVRRDNMRITRAISLSRQKTGSHLFSAAAAVRSLPYFIRVGAFVIGGKYFISSPESPLHVPRTEAVLMPMSVMMLTAVQFSSFSIAARICSVPAGFSAVAPALRQAAEMIRATAGVNESLSTTDGSPRPMRRIILPSIFSSVAPQERRILAEVLPVSEARARSRCSLPT